MSDLLASLKKRAAAMPWAACFTFAAGHLLLWALIATLFFLPGNLPWDAIGTPAAVLAALGHFGAIAFAPALLLTLLGGWLGKRFTFVAAVILYGLVTGFLVIDAGVFLQYRFHISPAMLSLFWHAGGEILELGAGAKVGIAAALAALFAAEAGAWLLCRRRAWPRLSLAIFAASMVSLAAFNAIHIWASFRLIQPVLIRTARLPYIQPATMERQLVKWGFQPVKPNGLEMTEGSIRYPLAPLAGTPPSQPLNVLIVALDALRADMLTPEVMPHLSARAERSERFFQHYSGSNCTRGGIFSLFYGLPATYWGSFLAATRQPVLLETAWQRGYEPAIFSSSSLASPEFNRTVFAGVPGLQAVMPGSSKRHRDEACNRNFAAFLKNRDPNRPFFGFIFHDCVHGYVFDRSKPKRFTPAWDSIDYLALTAATDRTPVFNLYRNAANFEDTLVEELLSLLDEHDLWRNTVVVITADHGQEINETGTNSWGHNSNFSRYQTQVPFLLFRPGAQPAAYHHRTTHFDVAPTLLREVFGIASPVRDYAVGTLLTDPAERGVLVLANYSSIALMQGDILVEMNPYGVAAVTDLELKPAAAPMPAKMLPQAAEIMARYRR